MSMRLGPVMLVTPVYEITLFISGSVFQLDDRQNMYKYG